MSLNKTCVFARSRSEKKICSHKNPRQYKRLTEGQLRVAEIKETVLSSHACAHHISKKLNEKFCCCPTSWDHSKYLIKCPKPFYNMFDEVGKMTLFAKVELKLKQHRMS